MQAFEEADGVHLVDVRITDIAEDMIPSNFLNGSSRATYIRYMKNGKMMIKHHWEFSVFGRL